MAFGYDERLLAALCNALHAIPLALYASLQFHRRFVELSGARRQGCNARRAREEDTRPLIHSRCFYRGVGRDNLTRSMDNLTHGTALNGL